MASTNKCEYCGSTITSEDKSCPNCGATNPLYVVDLPRRVSDPKTIEELQEYCAERGMPLLRMRFFIGENFKEPRAFGIYKEREGVFVVYKNKADGTRAERYRGSDEAKAVHEIFDKLIEECHSRGIYPDVGASAPDGTPGNYRSYNAPVNNKSLGDKINGEVRNEGFIVKMTLAIAVILILLRMLGRWGTGRVLDAVFSDDTSSSYSTDYDSGSSWGNSNSNSSWWDDSSSSSWWDDDDDDSWSSSNDDDWGSSDWDSDWGSDWSDWDSGSSDWDSDW
ncbi:MAG: zinc ribbon domain-containing protein [Lachnospiraceae bacterium]|nr:zinc ribbon domain-containing protein [Lachnospiraceae bacterium]